VVRLFLTLVALSESGNRASSVNETPGMGPV